MLQLLDFIFLWLHIIVILFNLGGWIYKRTRKMHLFVVGSTLFSWLILGFKYGFGYCFLTDWHWNIKYKLGEADLPPSFIKYFIDKYTFLNISAEVTDLITISLFGIAIVMTIYFNFLKSNSINKS